ncbi:MAG: DUF3822 family protein [Parafilimonas sp.]
MLQKTYSIYSDDLNDVQLCVEAGKNHIACWCKKPGDNTLRAFEFFMCDDYTAENFEALIDNTKLNSRLLTMPVRSTNFFWNTDEALCLPAGKDDADFLKANFDLMFGDSFDSKIFSASTAQCTVAWRLNDLQQHIAKQCFNAVAFSHPFTQLFSLLKTNNKTALYLFFYPNYFTLIAVKENKLQFAQTRKYAIPEDVLYFVLNVFKQYDIEKNTNIFCGGFIDEKSKLYEILYQYLEGFQLMQVDETSFSTDEFKQYSPHYFLPYINYVV